MDATTLDRLTDHVVHAIGDALTRNETVTAAGLHLLLRLYSTAAREDLAEPLGDALARVLDQQAQGGCDDDREGWLILFSEAAGVSDDPRLPTAAAALLPAVRARWSSTSLTARHPVDAVMRSVDACLLSINVPQARELAAEAIDALERVVAGAYRPGRGVSHEVAGAAFVRGGLADHVYSASALTTAYRLTTRLPYAMLADELMQAVLRTPELRDDREQSLAALDGPFKVNCEAVRVLCRLAALHRDDEYRRKAVLALDTDYQVEAGRMLTALEPLVRDQGVGSAPFGLALAEWLALR